MKRTKRARPPLDAPHVDDWQARALALGWRPVDVDSIQSMIVVRKPHGALRVIGVAKSTIELVDEVRIAISGVDRNGTPTEAVTARLYPWTYTNHNSPMSGVSAVPFDPDAVVGPPLGTPVRAGVVVQATPPAKTKQKRVEKHMPVGQKSLL